jgi:uncharacterized protein (DUF2249 family)
VVFTTKSLDDASTFLHADDQEIDQERFAELTRLLSRALRALGDAGRPADASRLAAAGWSALRDSWPVEAERLTGLLHYLARLPSAHADTQPDALTKENVMPGEDQQLDVRPETPARRHELIFDTYAKLDVGDNFVLVNDHDPKPLYYQFAAEHSGEFTWDALEAGPQVWRVRIGRTSAANPEPGKNANS